MTIPRLVTSLDRSVYYSIGEESEIRKISNATEKNISNLFSDILDSVKESGYRTCVGIKVTFIEYFYENNDLRERKFNILLPEDESGIWSFIRPFSIADARLIRFRDIGKMVAPLRISVLLPIESSDDEEMPPLEDYDADDEPEFPFLGVEL